jgi:hypothetical protein
VTDAERAALLVALIARAEDDTYAEGLKLKALQYGASGDAIKKAWEKRKQQQNVQTIYTGDAA